MLDFSSLVIASAQAQATSAGAMPPEPSPIASLVPFLLIVVIFWFLIIRPQSKRFKQHQEMVKALKKGDKVVTGGGIVGKVAKADADAETVQVEIAAGVTVEVTRSSISAQLPADGKKTAAPKTSAKSKKAPSSEQSEQTTANDN